MSGARHLAACEEGESPGGFSFSDRVRTIQHVTCQGDHARIDGVIVARGDRPIPRSPVPSAFAEPETPRRGQLVGAWRLDFDFEEGHLWIDDRSVPVGDANVVLFHGMDRARTEAPPEVVGTLRIPPTFFTGACVDGTPWTRPLLDRLLQLPEIRSFVGR